MKRLFTLIIALISMSALQAAENTLQGTVVDQDGNPIEGASVRLAAQYFDDIIEINGTTDKDGVFSITYDSQSNFNIANFNIEVFAKGYTGYYSYIYNNDLNGKYFVLYNALNFKAGERNSIILPVAPDASLGRYFRLGRKEDNKLIFEREYVPQANVPYIFIPFGDVHIDLSGMDLNTKPGNTIIEGNQGPIRFVGAYSSIRATISLSEMYSSVNGSFTYDDIHAPAQVYAMQATLLYHFNEFGNKTPEIILQDPDENYIPFVEKGKLWKVLGSCEGSGQYHLITDYYFDDEEITVGEHTYLNLCHGLTCEYIGIYREEDKRVYLYDEGTRKEYCVYDFTLKVGDTFDLGIGQEADRCVVTQVGHIDVKGKKLRTVTFSSVNPIDGHLLHENHTWIEGIGDSRSPIMGWHSNTYDSSWSYSLAYVSSDEYYFPFTIRGMWGANTYVMGQELVQGEGMTWEDYQKHGARLNYEIINGKLHVWGHMWLQPCPNYYVYCILSPKDDYRTYTVTLEDEIAGAETTCISTPYAVDLYFDLPTPEFRDYDYVYVDEDGEHPIVNHDKYIPFVEDGKVWKVGFYPAAGNTAIKLGYYYFKGDTIVTNHPCKKMMKREEDRESRHTRYEAALYEENQRVYCAFSGQENFVCLYDFGAEVGDTIDVYDCTNAWGNHRTSAVIVSKERGYNHKEPLWEGGFIEYIKGVVTKVAIPDGMALSDEEIRYNTQWPEWWMEGVGYKSNPLDNFGEQITGNYDMLMSCVTGNDTLYYNSRYTEDISLYWDDTEKNDGEVKKEQLDFTHTIKTRPTAPGTRASMKLLWGEYNDMVLSIDFEGMDGAYQISIKSNDEEKVHFATTQETSNLQSLDIKLTDYPEGEYTVTVENDEEAFTAQFALPLDGNSIKEIEDGKLKNENYNPQSIYDLSGRRIPQSSIFNPQSKKGIYIQGGRKLIVKP